jgi:PAS domain S-box-containing protein
LKQKSKKFLEALSQDQILGTIPSGLFLVDTNKNIVYWNHEAERITGYSSEEIIGQHCSFLEGIECGSGCGLFDKDAADKPIIGAECHIKTKNGKQLVIAKNVDYLRQDGQIVGGIESFIDITPQKKLEETLRQHGEELEQTVQQRTEALGEERSRLRSILDAMNDPAYIVTEDLEIDFINQATRELLGDGEGRLCYALLHGRETPCSGCPWPQVKKGQMVHEERSFGQNDRTYEIVHTPAFTSQGELQKLAVCRDITERKEAAEKLLELNKHLDSFVYTVSHDLRSPLTPIIGFAEFLKEEYRGKLDDQAINLLQEIENQGGRMLNLMEDLLDLSRVGYLPPPSDPVDVASVIQQVLHDNQPELVEKNIEVSVGKLPDLLIPETLIYELFSNLILNAARYGCNPGDKIEIGGGKEKDGLSFFIRDHGPGIPEKEREKVCNVFFRGTTSNGSQGTGIGLATVHKIVRLHNGSIRFEETAGGGCTVRLQFNS